MLTFIAVALGVMVGILLASVVTMTVMFNPKFVGWLANKYVSAMEKIMKDFEEKMGA